MKSKVYFIAVKDADDIPVAKNKLKNLLEKSRVLDFIQPKHKVAIKAHFGEAGNNGFVNPAFAGVICKEILKKSERAFLSDANTLYRGKRLNSADHLALAYEHGFTKEIVGVDVIIPDDAKKENIIDIEINQRIIKTAKVCRIFIEADALIAISHFKGHILTGFGGAIKNIGMGCATRGGKLAQHCDASPVVYVDRCTGCGECELVCPASAIQIKDNKSNIDKLKCIGCASCVAACPTMAMFIDIAAGDEVQEKMAEYAFAVLLDKKEKRGFVNFAVKINKECDCWNLENPRIAADVGMLASNDPVAVDQASLDLINSAAQKDIFKEVHPQRDGRKQLEYAQKLGLGNLDYELIKL